MENVIYWQGVQVGIEVSGRIQWFPSASKEAIFNLTKLKQGS